MHFKRRDKEEHQGKQHLFFESSWFLSNQDPFNGPYHKRERPWRQGPVVVDTVSHTHLDLSLLDPVAGSVVQQTHYSVEGKLKGLTEKRRAGTLEVSHSWGC